MNIARSIQLIRDANKYYARKIKNVRNLTWLTGERTIQKIDKTRWEKLIDMNYDDDEENNEKESR